ncbi:MAG: VOC family protein [Christensenellaceae bacterium]|jgi:lactoylglutathione lyase|nr:VOC family protein [Christensenellaceae bacterium]
MFRFAHENYNVLSIEKSKIFYEKALGLKEGRRINGDGFTLVFLRDSETDYELELTEVHGRTEPYDIGEAEFHLAFTTPNIAEAHKKHSEMGVIVYENPAMGIYFIADPDGYWLEIVPAK